MLIFHIFTLTFSDFKQIYFLYLVGAVFELLVIMWFTYRWYAATKVKKRDKKKEEKAVDATEEEGEI